MYPSKEDLESRRLVRFYLIYTSIYFPAILLTLYWSGGMYTVGKYNFQIVLLIIVFAETTKYFASVVQKKKSYVNLLKKPQELTISSFIVFLLSKSRIREGFKTVATVSIMTAVYFVISVLYGAEVFSKHEETLMFSALLSVLTIFPLCVNLGSFSVLSVLIGCRPGDKLEMLLYQNVYLTLLGAWFGAFVIPLDWDQPWQEWPVPCSCGAMIGFLTSHILMTFQLTFITSKGKVK